MQTQNHAGLNHLSPSLAALHDQLDDFGLPKHLPRASAQRLPPYVPQIEPHTPLLSSMPRAAALTLGDFVSAGGQSYRGGIKKACLLRESGASVVVLVGTSFDGQLEAVWKEPLRFIDALNDAEIDIVLGPAFSIYRGRPTLERLANRSRNLDLYRTLSEAGIQAIPAVGFIDAVDAAFVGNWVERYGLRSIFVDLQSADAPKSWDHVRESLPALIARATSLDRIVINGVAQPDRVIELARLTEPTELVLTNGHAFHLARNGREYCLVDGRFTEQRTATPRAEAFENLAHFYCEAAARRADRYVSRSVQLRFAWSERPSSPPNQSTTCAQTSTTGFSHEAIPSLDLFAATN